MRWKEREDTTNYEQMSKTKLIQLLIKLSKENEQLHNWNQAISAYDKVTDMEENYR